MVVGAGIGISAVSSFLQQLVYHRWTSKVAGAFHQKVFFCLVIAYKELETCRWIIRIIKESLSEFECSTVRKNSIRIDIKPGEDEVAYWGKERFKGRKAIFEEIELYRKMLIPNALDVGFGKRKAALVRKYVTVSHDRPDWDVLFSTLARERGEGNVAVASCGNPRIADELQDKCLSFSNEVGRVAFEFYKETF